MGEQLPLVSIGVPVFNGMPYLPAAIESVRRQTHRQLEIVICDNASTDGTENYCRAACEDDPRIRYHRFAANAGPAKNFRRCIDLSAGEFFAWAAHDDRYHREFVAKCLSTLQAHPEAVMCAPAHRLVDQTGRVVRVIEEPPGLSSGDLQTRLRAHLRRNSWYTLYGLGRRTPMSQLPGPVVVWGADVLYIWLLLLSSPIAVIDDPLMDYLLVKPRTMQDVVADLDAPTQTLRGAHTGLRNTLREGLDDVPLDAASRDVALRVLRRWTLSRFFLHQAFRDVCAEAARLDNSGNFVPATLLLLLGLIISPRAAAGIIFRRVRRQLQRGAADG